MEEFVKPNHIVIDAIPYLTEIMGKGLIKDIGEDEVICPICRGTGLAIDNYPYGLSNDPDKKAGMFPYKKQFIGGCHTCYNGVLKVCQHCGKHLTRRDYQCNCSFAEAERKAKEADKETKLFEKSIKLDANDPKAQEMKMLYSDSYGCNEGYFFDWEEFFEYWYDNHAIDESKPTYVWGTDVIEMSMDADSIVESATDDLHDEARSNISDADIKELQNYLDSWCSKQSGTTTYAMNTKYSILIPWDTYK